MNSWFEDNGNNIADLHRDDCYVKFKNDLKEDVRVYSLYSECQKVSLSQNLFY